MGKYTHQHTTQTTLNGTDQYTKFSSFLLTYTHTDAQKAHTHTHTPLNSQVEGLHPQ